MHTRSSRIILVVALFAVAVLLVPDPATESTPPLHVGSSASTASAPIVVTTDDVTIDGVTIDGPLLATDDREIGIKAWGTAAKPIRNLTIRDCTIRGFKTAIDARYVVGLVVEGCLIEDASYGGIMVYSGIGGRIAGNEVQRIGVGIDTNGPDGNNAYGIALSRIATRDFTADPRTSDFVVDGNVVEDVPLWHCLDTHAGSHITFSNNILRGCPRAIFITTDGIASPPMNITVSGNRLEAGVQVPGGTNLTAITLVGLETGTISNNAVSESYPTPFIYDYVDGGTRSTGVAVSGETVIP